MLAGISLPIAHSMSRIGEILDLYASSPSTCMLKRYFFVCGRVGDVGKCSVCDVNC
jgi:hypothetical protein